jgi:hypothetical protein
LYASPASLSVLGREEFSSCHLATPKPSSPRLTCCLLAFAPPSPLPFVHISTASPHNLSIHHSPSFPKHHVHLLHICNLSLVHVATPTSRSRFTRNHLAFLSTYLHNQPSLPLNSPRTSTSAVKISRAFVAHRQKYQ